MLINNFPFVRKYYFYGLFTRRIFLSYDFFCFLNILSFSSYIYFKFRIALKKRILIKPYKGPNWRAVDIRNNTGDSITDVYDNTVS